MSASGVAASRLASIASMSSWLLLAIGRRRRCRLGAPASGAIGRWRNVLHHRRLGGRRRPASSQQAGWRASRRRQASLQAAWLQQAFGFSRLGFVVGDDATDRRQNLLHRGLLDLCRLRHLRLHIETILHQATTGFAGSGYAGRDFHRTSLTCPQIKPARRIARGSAPPQGNLARGSDRRRKSGANRPAASEKGMSRQQMIASNAPGALRTAGDDVIPRTYAADGSIAISDRQACGRRPSCRAPDDNARSDRRSRSPG